MTNPALAAKKRIDDALEALRVALASYVAQRMEQRYGKNWRHYASRAAGGDPGAELDAYALLKTILDHWGGIFGGDARLKKARSYLSIAMDGRNTTSHFVGFMEDREALRYLDAIREVLRAINAGTQEKIVAALWEEQHKAQPPAPATSAPEVPRKADEPPTPETLRPWREVAQPHPDVLEARFTDAEFAANLATVDDGTAREEEYTDPHAFFRITFLTGGLSRVLRSTIERLAGKGGDPVVGLQTNFGGGKTHTMLALYHLAGARQAGYGPQLLTGLKPIFEAAGVETLPEVKRAVFVGTHKGPSEVMHRSNGREVRTLWGYVAWRLGGWPAVDGILESEKNRTNPGSEKFAAILKKAAPCLILLDELVAYAKQLRDLEYEAFHAFIQSLTEAAAAVSGVVLVGSLPASRTEVGDDRGYAALLRLQQLFGRVQTAWAPARDLETFEIVRRRLFQELDEDGEKARDGTVAAFSKMYRDNASDFPPDAREVAYRDAMRRAYPIHPEVLKRFSEDWSTLSRFQRTRGILKIMANAVYALWRGQSNAPLILPGFLPLDDDKVLSGLLDPLDGAYRGIVQAEVDGEISLPRRMEASRRRYGDARAATRAARAVFLATAPHGGSSHGGVTGPGLRLACAQPGDQLSIFGDALRELSERAAFLYREGDRYRFSTQPTLNRIADERAGDVSLDDADAEIAALLKRERPTPGGFHHVYVAPDHPIDIDDRRALSLVILPPAFAHMVQGDDGSAAARTVRDTLERRGSGQRKYRNCLIFCAADEAGLASAREIARNYLAWTSVVADASLTSKLTMEQLENARTRTAQTREALAAKLRSVWSHVIFPAATSPADGTVAPSTKLEFLTVRNGARTLSEAIYNKLAASGNIVSSLGAQALLTDLNKVWDADAPHVAIAQLLEWFGSFVYLQRLRDDVTLIEAIKKTMDDLASPVAFAGSFDLGSGTYGQVVRSGLLFGEDIESGFLVRKSVLPAEPALPVTPTARPPSPAGTSVRRDHGTLPVPQPKRFFGSIVLDPDKAGLQVAAFAKEVLIELSRPRGAAVRLTLEIEGEAPDGYPADVIDVVRSNLRDLKLDVSNTGFDND